MHKYYSIFRQPHQDACRCYFGNITSYKRKRIDVGVSADYRTWVKNAVATYLYVVTEHCTELFNICVNLIAVAKNSYKALVTLEV